METIVKAAIRYRDRIFLGWRHHVIIQEIADTYGPSTRVITEQQGFVTGDGRFVDRHEALRIAQAAGQKIIKHAPHSKLVSEDLWDANGVAYK